MNIYEKINKIMNEVKSLKKDGKVAFGNTKYNYLSEAKTTEIFREKLIENKMVLLPVHADETKDGSVTHGVYTYRLVNVENPEEQIELMAGGQGHDSADKGSGKSSSYAYKYLLWRTFAVPSNDDPDSVSSAEIETGERKGITNAAEWDKYSHLLMDKAAILGIMPKDVPGVIEKKYKIKYYDATIKQLQKAISDMEKKIDEST